MHMDAVGKKEHAFREKITLIPGGHADVGHHREYLDLADSAGNDCHRGAAALTQKMMT